MRPAAGYKGDGTAYKLFVYIFTIINYIHIDIGNSDSNLAEKILPIKIQIKVPISVPRGKPKSWADFVLPHLNCSDQPAANCLYLGDNWEN